MGCSAYLRTNFDINVLRQELIIVYTEVIARMRESRLRCPAGTGNRYFTTAPTPAAIPPVICTCLQLLSETFHILRRSERDMITNAYWSSCNVRVIIVSLYWNFHFLDRFFVKYWNTKFHDNLSGGSRVLTCGRTDARADMTLLPRTHFEDNLQLVPVLHMSVCYITYTSLIIHE